MININYQKLILSLSYIIYPLVGIFARIMGLESFLTRNWIDIAWLITFGILAVIFLRYKARAKYLFGEKTGLLLVATFLSLVIIFVFIKFFWVIINDSSISSVPYFMEFKPVFYFSIASLWIFIFESPPREYFVQMGAWLGTIIFLDFVIESLFAGKFVRILGSGEINYDAALLLISLSATFRIDKRWKISETLIYLGLFSTLSRTALATFVIVMLLFSKKNIFVKLLFSIFSVFGIFISFLTRNIPLRVLSADRYWMWKSALDLLSNNIEHTFAGFPLGVALPVKIPPALFWLWKTQQEGWGITGIFQYNFHAFWLRGSISWGVPVMVIFLLILLSTIFLSQPNARDLKSLSTLCIIEGLTMGLFYLSNVSIPLYLAFWSFLKRNVENSKHMRECCDNRDNH